MTRDSRAKRSCRAYSDMLKPASRFGDKVRVGKGCKRGLAMRGQSAAANTTLEVRASHKYVYNRVSGEAVGRANGETALDQILSFRIISGN